MRQTVFLFCLPLAVGLVLSAGCSNKYVRNAVGTVGEEAAYAALESALAGAGITSAGHMVSAVRMVADDKDYGGAFAAFTLALEEHNVGAARKLTSTQVISVMRLAEPSVRKASSRVANALDEFCDYAESHG